MDLGKSLAEFWVSPTFAACQIETLPRGTAEVRDSVCPTSCGLHALPDFSTPRYASDGSRTKRYQSSHVTTQHAQPLTTSALQPVEKGHPVSGARDKMHVPCATRSMSMTRWTSPLTTPRLNSMRGQAMTPENSPYMLGVDDLELIEQTMQGPGDVVSKLAVAEIGPFDSFELVQAAQEPERFLGDVVCGADMPAIEMDDVPPPADYNTRYDVDAGRAFDAQLGPNLYLGRYQGPNLITGQQQESVKATRDESEMGCTHHQDIKDPRTVPRKQNVQNMNSISLSSGSMSVLQRAPPAAAPNTPAIGSESEIPACPAKQSDRIADLSHIASNSAAPSQLSGEEPDFHSTGCFETDELNALLEVSEAAFSKQDGPMPASSRQSKMIRDTHGNDTSNTSEDHPDLLTDDILIGLYQAALSSNLEQIGGRHNGLLRHHRSPDLGTSIPLHVKSFGLNSKCDGEGITRLDFASHTSSPTRVDESNDEPEKSIAFSDQYEDLSDDLKFRIDALREKISQMPRRKLRESLADKVTLADIEPLMAVNRDDLATMLSLGVTTWKSFVHQELGISRWPARSLKSSATKTRETKERLSMAMEEGRSEDVVALHKELERLQSDHEHIMEQLRAAARSRKAEKYKAEQAFDEAMRVFTAHDEMDEQIESESQIDCQYNADASSDGRKRRKVC